MAKSVLNKSKTVDFTKQPMFFGEDLQIQRYDTMKYPIFDKLTQQQLGYFWRPYIVEVIHTSLKIYTHNQVKYLILL